jgi:hypothetical protein
MRRRPLSIMLLVSVLFALSLIAVGTRLGAQEGMLTEGETPGAPPSGGGSLNGGGEPAVATFPAAVGEMATLMPTATFEPSPDISAILNSNTTLTRGISYMLNGNVHMSDVSDPLLASTVSYGGNYPLWSLSGRRIGFLNNAAQVAVSDFTSSPIVVGGSAGVVIPRLSNSYWDVVWSKNVDQMAFVLSSDTSSTSNRVDILRLM